MRPSVQSFYSLIFSLLVLGGAIMASPVSCFANERSFRLEWLGKRMVFETASGLSSIKGYQRQGLVSVSRRADALLLRYWQKGAFRETVSYNGTLLVDGYDVSDMARISSFRLARDGSYVYIRSGKGPASRVRLLQDGTERLSWPRGHSVRLLSFDKKELITAQVNQNIQATEIIRYARTKAGMLSDKPQKLGQLEDCFLQAAKAYQNGFLLQAYCSHERGSDILFLDRKSGRVRPLLTTSADEWLFSHPDRAKGEISVLTIAGNANGRRAFHAISSLLLSSLGEPMSLASDEAGKQSWGQSYRLRALGLLSQKTKHPIFAALARYSMRQTLQQQNIKSGLQDRYNPSCGWRSRLYSKDAFSPVSLLVNQAMIATSLLKTCERLGAECPRKLRQQIMDNARCLVTAYEANFDPVSGLYRIAYGAPFRFDGLWAPWNWQMAWAPILQAVGKHDQKPYLVERAKTLASAFLNSWSLGDKGALWRYWTPAYYAGWDVGAQISQNRPTQAKHKPKRYEDIAHAGIALLGLKAFKSALEPHRQKAVRFTLDRLLDGRVAIARDLDGSGPRHSRWLPGAGFDAFATEKMKHLYSRFLPGARSGDQLLAYALLFEPEKEVDIDLRLLSCSLNACSKARQWSFSSVGEFLNKNPLFAIKELD